MIEVSVARAEGMGFDPGRVVPVKQKLTFLYLPCLISEYTESLTAQVGPVPVLQV